jgi:hypothetical protein
VDPANTTLGGLAIALLTLVGRYAVMRVAEWLEIRILAAAERSRRREVKRIRRESSGPHPLPPAVPQEFEDETTDSHDLFELERKHRKARKVSTERAPRRGTHHDE